MESPKRPSKLIFVVLNFMIATSYSLGVWYYYTSDDVVDTHACDLLKSLLLTDLDK